MPESIPRRFMKKSANPGYGKARVCGTTLSMSLNISLAVFQSSSFIGRVLVDYP